MVRMTTIRWWQATDKVICNGGPGNDAALLAVAVVATGAL